MDRSIDAVGLVAELHRRQVEMYAGGSTAPVVELLAEDIVWHVPGRSPIAGDHRGVPQVIDYLDKRRKLVNSTMRMHPGEVLSEELRRYVLARGDVMLQSGVMAEGKGNALIGQLDDLRVGVASGGPALNIGRLGPPAIVLMVVDDTHGLHQILQVRVASGLRPPQVPRLGQGSCGPGRRGSSLESWKAKVNAGRPGASRRRCEPDCRTTL